MKNERSERVSVSVSVVARNPEVSLKLREDCFGIQFAKKYARPVHHT